MIQRSNYHIKILVLSLTEQLHIQSSNDVSIFLTLLFI